MVVIDAGYHVGRAAAAKLRLELLAAIEHIPKVQMNSKTTRTVLNFTAKLLCNLNLPVMSSWHQIVRQMYHYMSSITHVSIKHRAHQSRENLLDHKYARKDWHRSGALSRFHVISHLD